VQGYGDLCTEGSIGREKVIIRLPPVPWTEKTIERSLFFIQCGGHCCCRDLVGWTTFDFFFEWFAEVRATG